MSTERKIAAHYLLAPQGLRRGATVCLNSEGVVEDIVYSDHIDRESGVEFYNGILIPDMVNAHTHLELSYLKGAIKVDPSRGFASFAESMGAVRNSFTEAERLQAIEFWDAKMYAEGVGAVADICNGVTTISTKLRSKIYYHSFAELFGLGETDSSAVDGVVEGFRGAGLRSNITPHSIYSLNKQAFMAAVGSDDAPLSIHFMESSAESDLFRRQGRLYEWYCRRGSNVDFLDEGSPVERIIANIPASRKIMLVHCSHITKEDIKRLVAHFRANLTVVLCPCSNIYIEGRTIDMDMVGNMGCRIAVGSDSLASADSLSVIDQLKIFDTVPLEERLRWATIYGAEALGVAERFGAIEIGRRSGIVLVSGVDFETMSLRADASARRII